MVKGFSLLFLTARGTGRPVDPEWVWIPAPFQRATLSNRYMGCPCELRLPQVFGGRLFHDAALPGS